MMMNFTQLLVTLGCLVFVACTKQGDLISTSTIKKYGDNVMNTYGRYPLTISHGKGCLLYNTEGKEFLDFASGIATCCLGHSHPKLTAAITNQMNCIHHCSNLYYIPQQAALAEWLVKNSCADKAFFCNSGAEANEAAIKLARKYAHTKLGIRFPVILTAKNSFHGRTLATVTATAQPKYQKDFEPLMPGFEYVEYNDIEELKSTVEKIRKDESKGLAAIMMEPLQGEGGVRPGDASFFQTVRQLCDDTGALMIVDEVQTGMGRTGKLWGYENLGIEPDVITNAKALGGGVPIGVMLCKEKFNVFQPGDHASTYGGNPLACSAGLAVTEVFDEEKIVSQVARKGEEFRQLAVELLQKKFPKIVKEVRGWGLINGIQLFEESKLTAADITKELLQAGVLVVPAGPKVVRFVPPLIVTTEEIKLCLEKVADAIKQLS